MNIYKVMDYQKMLQRHMCIDDINEKAHLYCGFDIDHKLILGAYIKFPLKQNILVNTNFMKNTNFFIDCGLITVITTSSDGRLVILVYATVD